MGDDKQVNLSSPTLLGGNEPPTQLYYLTQGVITL